MKSDEYIKIRNNITEYSQEQSESILNKFKDDFRQIKKHYTGLDRVMGEKLSKKDFLNIRSYRNLSSQFQFFSKSEDIREKASSLNSIISNYLESFDKSLECSSSKLRLYSRAKNNLYSFTISLPLIYGADSIVRLENALDLKN